MNVVVAVPCLDFCPTPFAFSLATMMATPQKDSLGRPIKVSLIHHQGSILMEARNTLTRQARAMGGATHMLWLDSDMTFPPLTIQRLAAHGVGIATTSYVKRYPPYELLGVMTPPEDCGPPRKGLAQMEIMPLGVSLIKLSVYDDIEEPWFEYKTTRETSFSEDTIWCLKARKAGHTIWMDVELTKELGHVGIHTFRPKETVR